MVCPISLRAYSYRLHANSLLQGLFVSGKLLQERATVSGKGQAEHRVHNDDHYHDPTLCRQPYVTHVTVFGDVFLVVQSNELHLLNRGSTTEDEEKSLWFDLGCGWNPLWPRQSMFRFPRVRGSTSYPYAAKAADRNDLELTSISLEHNNGRHALTTYQDSFRLDAQAQEPYA